MGMRDWVAKVVTGGAGVAEKGSLSRFPFLAKTQDASRKRWGERRRLTVEPLEPRLMLNAVAAGSTAVWDLDGGGSGTTLGYLKNTGSVAIDVTLSGTDVEVNFNTAGTAGFISNAAIDHVIDTAVVAATIEVGASVTTSGSYVALDASTGVDGTHAAASSGTGAVRLNETGTVLKGLIVHQAGSSDGDVRYVQADSLGGNITIAGAITDSDGGSHGIHLATDSTGNISIGDGLTGSGATIHAFGDWAGDLNLDANADGIGIVSGGTIEIDGKFSSNINFGVLTANQTVLVNDWTSGDVTASGFNNNVALTLDADFNDDGVGGLHNVTINDTDLVAEALFLNINAGDGTDVSGVGFGVNAISFGATAASNGDDLHLALKSTGSVNTILVTSPTGFGNNDLVLDSYTGSFTAAGIQITTTVLTPTDGNLGTITVNSADKNSDLEQDSGAGTENIAVNGNITDVLVGGSIVGSGSGLTIGADANGDRFVTSGAGKDGEIGSVKAGLGVGPTTSVDLGNITNTTISEPLAKAHSIMSQAQENTTFLTFGSANWTNSSRTITQSGAFTNYFFKAGDTLVMTSGSGVVVGQYTVAAKLSNDAITVVDDINGGSGDISDSSVAGTITRKVDYLVVSSAAGTTANVTAVFNGSANPTYTIRELQAPSSTLAGFGVITRAAGTSTGAFDAGTKLFDGTDVNPALSLALLDVGQTLGFLDKDQNFINGAFVTNEVSITNLVIEGELLGGANQGIDLDDQGGGLKTPGTPGSIGILTLEDGFSGTPTIEVDTIQAVVLGDGDNVNNINWNIGAPVAVTQLTDTVVLKAQGNGSAASSSLWFRSDEEAAYYNATKPDGSPLNSDRQLFDQAVRLTPVGGEQARMEIAAVAQTGGFSINGVNAGMSQAPTHNADGTASGTGWAIGAVSVSGADPIIEFSSATVSIASTVTLNGVEVAGSLGSLTVTDPNLTDGVDVKVNGLAVGFWLGANSGPNSSFDNRNNSSFFPTGAVLGGASAPNRTLIAPGVNLAYETAGILNDYVIEGGAANLGPVSIDGDWTGKKFVTGSMLGAVNINRPDKTNPLINTDVLSSDIMQPFAIGDDILGNWTIDGDLQTTANLAVGVLKIAGTGTAGVGANGLFFGATDNVDEGGTAATTGANSSLILQSIGGGGTLATTKDLKSAFDFANSTFITIASSATDWDLYSGNIGTVGTPVVFKTVDTDGDSTTQMKRTIAGDVTVADSIWLNIDSINSIGPEASNPGTMEIAAIVGDIGANTPTSATANFWRTADEQVAFQGGLPGASPDPDSTPGDLASDIRIAAIYAGKSFYTDINAGYLPGASTITGTDLSVGSLEVDETFGRTVAEGATLWRADNDVNIGPVDIGFGDSAGTSTNLPGGYLGDLSDVGQADESWYVNVYAGLEANFDPSDGVSANEVTRSLFAETDGNINFDQWILIDDNFGIGGQATKNGILASGNVTFGSVASAPAVLPTYLGQQEVVYAGMTIRVGGVARGDVDGKNPGIAALGTAGGGFIANSFYDPSNQIDEGGSWLINVVGGISDGVPNAAGQHPETGSVTFNSRTETTYTSISDGDDGYGWNAGVQAPQVDESSIVIDDDFGEVPTLAPSAAFPFLPTYASTTSGNVISATGDIQINGDVYVGVSFNTFTGGFNADGTPDTASYGFVNSVNGTVNYDGAHGPDALYDYTGDGGRDISRSVGDMNIDFAAGMLSDAVPINFTAGLQYQPVFANINDVADTLPGGRFPHFLSTDSNIGFQDMNVGVSIRQGAGNVILGQDDRQDEYFLCAGDPIFFYPDDPATPSKYEGPANFNSNFVAASDIISDTDTLFIAGNLVGRDGVGGRAFVAGAGYIGASFSSPNLLSLHVVVVGDTLGGFASGMFVPFDDQGPSPLDPNDLGVLQAGTVLTLGKIDVSLTTGRLLGANNGTNPLAPGITLEEALTGQEGLADQTYVGRSTFAATHDIVLCVAVVGRPFIPAQVAYNPDGSGAVIADNLGSDTPNPADADATAISIMAFGGIKGTFTADNLIQMNFVMANVDSVTAIDTGGYGPGDPSQPSTTLPFNAGTGSDDWTVSTIHKDLQLDVSAYGNGSGGLSVVYFTAGFDPFVRINVANPAAKDVSGNLIIPNGAPDHSLTTVPKVPDFWAAWAMDSDIHSNLYAGDADATNGLEAGKLTFALIGAARNIGPATNGTSSYVATDDIIAYTGDSTTDGTPGLIPDGFGGWLAADFIAGLSVNKSISQFGEADLFPDGNIICTQMIAGDDIWERKSAVGGTPDQTTVVTNTFSTAAQVLAYGNAAFDTLTFNDFNPAAVSNPTGGTVALTGVTMTATSNVSAGTATLTRPDTTTAASGGVTMNQSSVLTSAEIAGGPFTLDNTVSAPVALGIGDATVTVGIPADSTGVVTLTPAGLATFLGAGTFDVGVAKTQDAVRTGAIGGGGIELNTVGGLFSGQVTVQYTYTITSTTIIPGTPPTIVGNPFVTIAAKGANKDGYSGNVDITLVSGTEDQLAGPDLFNGFQGFQGQEYSPDNDLGIPGNVDDETGNIWALIIAGGDVTGLIDAGDTHQLFGGITDGGLGGAGGTPTGAQGQGDFFRGGIHAGAGADLNIMTTTDNDPKGDIKAAIWTNGDLNVEDFVANPVPAPGTGSPRILLGIMAEGSIKEARVDVKAGSITGFSHDGHGEYAGIQVGWGCVGGNLLGNVIAEGDIEQIEVYGDVGRAGQDSLIFAGDNIDEFVVGNPIGWGDSVAGHPEVWNTSTFGTVYADVYIGGADGDAQPDLHFGQGFAADSVLIAGLDGGLDPSHSRYGGNIAFETFGHTVTFDNAYNRGTRMVLVQVGGEWGSSVPDPYGAPGYGPDVWLYNCETDPTTGDGEDVGLSVYGDGAPAGIGKLIAVDNLDTLEVIDGSVGKIIVNDDYNISTDIGAALSLLLGIPTTTELNAEAALTALIPFATNSLPSVKEIQYAVNNSKEPINLDFVNVDYNIGVPGVSIGKGLTGISMADNAAIWVQGQLGEQGISSETGSIGNMVAGTIDYDAEIHAHQDIGDLYVNIGGLDQRQSIIADIGSVGVISVQDNIEISGYSQSGYGGGNSGVYINAEENLGGLIARHGSLSVCSLEVHGSVGLLEASDDITGDVTAETGSIGLDLDATDMFTPVDGAGIHSDVGEVDVILLAGGDIGNVEAGTDVEGRFTSTKGRMGNITALTGDIGNSWDPLVIRTNGGVVIDPLTLDYAPITDTNGNGVLDERNGIGNIFSDIGSIWVDATTATDLGANAAGGVVVGGIAAPIGTVDAVLHVGGDVGGISGTQSGPGWTGQVNGIVGVIHHNYGNNNTDTTRVIGPSGTLTVSSGGVNYLITIGGGNGNVTYTDVAGFVTFDQINYNSDGSPTSGVTLLTKTLGGADSPVLAHVVELNVDGNVNTVAVEGDVDNLYIDGDLGLANGSLNIQHNLGSLTVTGNVGTSGGTNHNLSVVVGGHFGSAEVDGTNFFMQEETVDSKSNINIASVGVAGKSLSFMHGHGEITNIFLASGSANIFFDGTVTGQVSEIDLLGTSASGLLIVESDHVMTLDELKAQAGMVKKGQLQTKVKGVVVKNEVSDHGSTVEEPATAVVGSILGNTAKFKLNGLILEGDVDTVFTAGSLENANITGDAWSVDGGQSIKNLSVGDDLGIAKAVQSIVGVTVGDNLRKTITAGGKVDSVIVLGDAGTINAGNTVSNVNVLGKAGVISAGKSLKNIAVAGDMLALNAMTMTNVAVRGGVGLAIDCDNNITLGGSFCATEAARIFGLGDNLSYYDAGDALRAIGIKGANHSSFLGGVEAVKVSGVSVGGAISNLNLTGQSVLNGGADGLLTSTVNDAFVAGKATAKVGLANNWVKNDGVLIEWPGMSVSTSDISLDIQGLKDLFKQIINNYYD